MTSWATRLVFSPAVWAGVIVAGASAALFLASALMRSRSIGVREKKPTKEVAARRPQRHESGLDDMDDMADIEAILKKHGI